MGNYNLSDIQVAYLLDLLEVRADDIEEGPEQDMIQGLMNMGNYNLSDVQVTYLLDLLEVRAEDIEEGPEQDMIQGLMNILTSEIGPDFKPFPEA